MGQQALAFQSVVNRIRSATDHPDRVTLIAVSKTKSIEQIQTLYSLGQRDFGENYVQELLEKSNQALALGMNEIRWHFIGHLQTNKIKPLLSGTPGLTAIHSVDSRRTAHEIAKRSARPVSICLEINIDDEETKSGFRLLGPEFGVELAPLVNELRSHPHLTLRGLMCIPAALASEDQKRIAFSRLKNLAKGLRLDSPWLSMGMSDDFELAISEGATHIRVGTALFGARELRK